jgi:hypothetical protein
MHPDDCVFSKYTLITQYVAVVLVLSIIDRHMYYHSNSSMGTTCKCT